MGSQYSDLDTALIRARRLFETPPMVTDDGQRIEASTLLVLAALEGQGEPTTISDVAAWLDVSHSTASRLIARAVAAGTVTRSPSPADRRESTLSATPAGRKLAARARTYRQARLAELLHDWTPDDVASFTALLRRLVGDQEPGIAIP